MATTKERPPWGVVDAALAVAMERDLTLIVDYHAGRWHVSLQTFGEGAFILKGDGQTLIDAMEPVTAHLEAAGAALLERYLYQG